MPKRYVIFPLASFVYDDKGITYPFKNECKLQESLKAKKAKSLRWRIPPKKYQKNMWYQKRVLCFSLEEGSAKELSLPYGLKLSERQWK
jgi:hypothetical protein